MKETFNFCDIFGVPVLVTRDARLSQWRKLCCQVFSLGLQNCVFPFSELNLYVIEGFLSASSASYFLTGRCTLSQFLYLETFASFWDSCVQNHVLSSFKVFQLWQKTKNVVPENTFLFPLAELDSDTGFDLSELSMSDTEIIDGFKALGQKFENA